MRVGPRSEPGLHLVQVIRRGATRDVEMLVVYPSDGYWRLKPLPPAHLQDTAYGSSFLVGPVEERGRPYVALRAIDFDPATLTFRLAFADGSRGSLAIAAATPRHIELEVRLEDAGAARSPVRRVAFDVRARRAGRLGGRAMGRGRRHAGGRADPRVRPVPCRLVRFGRDEPSRHNLSAPDVVFDRFEAAGPGERVRPQRVGDACCTDASQ